jgi:transposase-like protein
MTYFDVPIKKSLIDTVCNNVEYGSTVFTDEYSAYGSLEEHGFIHKSINHSQKEYASGTIHVNNCECKSNLYQLWIRKFMGVNKHNLQTYSKTFQFIHNNRKRGIKTREERFAEILHDRQLKHSEIRAIIFMSRIAIFGLSSYKVVLIIDSIPADMSVKKLLVHTIDRFVDIKSISNQEPQQKIAIDVIILFFAIISAIVLLMNGLLVGIFGLTVWIQDRRARKKSMTQ